MTANAVVGTLALIHLRTLLKKKFRINEKSFFRLEFLAQKATIILMKTMKSSSIPGTIHYHAPTNQHTTNAN